MLGSVTGYYENYTPAADVLVIAIGIVFIILIRNAYINRTRGFLYLRFIIGILMLSAAADLIYNVSMSRFLGVAPKIVHYFFRSAYHIGLFSTMWLFVLYAKDLLGLDKKTGRPYFHLAAVGFYIIVFNEIAGTVFKFGFYIDNADNIHMGFPIFPFGYMYYIVILSVMVFKHRSRFIRQVVASVTGTVIVSVVIMAIQQLYRQSSFTAATFLFPVYALLYHVHSNPYNIEIGTVSESAFEERIGESRTRKEKLYLMSLYMHDFEGKGRKYPPEIQGTIRYFSSRFFKSATLFQISGGHMIMAVDTLKNPDYLESGQKMLDEFNRVYPRYKIDYKIVYTGTYDLLNKDNDYIGYISFLHDRMPQNSFLAADEKDVKDYLKYKYIVDELADIALKNNYEDERVHVYCQPVFNIRSKTFDTAEALMRLVLPKTGMIYPNEFISIAEKNQYIGVLTKIILFKTCKQIRYMLDKGYNVKRISVNFSVYDIREDSFCETAESIIKSNGIPFGKIAIEITESQNEKDFELIKTRIEELKESGIKFYLDDFGTGYSNFERIMELPFDIVKFDRSLVIASGIDDRSKTMVSNLARMFKDVNYSVLYEGVEDENDESRCIDMEAKYLQGYKYSKPIPIERLTEYFEKIG
ncbi:MAG: EAL domain-containing protein [Lachnospiraceae bacterium]|nr:EAL domain-containing protein [Lachnospiraceae bacterium]